MSISLIAQQLLGARDRYLSLIAEALKEISGQFSKAYSDMGWFSISTKRSGLRKNRLEAEEFQILGQSGGFLTVDSEGNFQVVSLAGMLDALGFYEFEHVLTADVTLGAPVAATAGARLLLYIFQDAATVYTPSFNTSDFVDSPALYIDLGMAVAREYAGRADGKWYPIGPAFQFNPNA